MTRSSGFEGDVVVGLRFAHFGSEDEAEFAGARFFIGVHGGDQFFWRNIGPRRERGHSANERNDAGDLVGGREADFVAEEGGGHHAPGDGFAVLVDAIVGDGFEGMAEGVAEIQDFAEAGFALVAANDLRFDFEAARDDVWSESGRVAAKDGVEVLFEKGEEFCVGDYAVLDDFGEAAAVLAFGERLQHGGVDDDQASGIESSYEILAFRKIDAGFSADGAVDLGDERSRNL